MTNINKTVALAFGIVFLLIGIIGFIPVLTPGGAILGLFMVNRVHSIVHLLFGVLGMAAARCFIIAAQAPGGMLLGLVMINLADNFLHLVIGIVLADVGFAIQTRRVAIA